MDTTAPIACSLSPNDMVGRFTEFRALFARHLTGVQRSSPRHVVFRFADADPEAVRDLFAREHACCRFFAFDVAQSGTEVAVSAAVPEDAAGALAGLLSIAAEAAPDVMAA